MNGIEATGPVVIYDTDGGYIGNVIAEKLHADGHAVTIATPSPEIAGYLTLTMEQNKVVARMMELGIEIIRLKSLAYVGEDHVQLECVYGGEGRRLDTGSVVIVSGRKPNDSLYQALSARPDDLEKAGIKSVDRIGDCEAPGIIAFAVHDGHRYARDLDRKGSPAYLPYIPEMNQAEWLR